MNERECMGTLEIVENYGITGFSLPLLPSSDSSLCSLAVE